jgi:exopolysaccharide biosynthesis predicted pyruvyltransferase EpsI
MILPSPSRRDWYEDVRAGLVQSLETAAGPCAMLLYRDYSNVGDAAIWVAQKRLLRDLGLSITYASTRDGYARNDLSRRCPEGPIFISGGGSLGTPWPATHALKERVIAEFPDREIVILPQSGTFRSRESLERFAEVAATHRRLTVMARDRSTFELLRPVDVKTLLVPDMAMTLTSAPLIRKYVGPTNQGIRLLLRTDAERAGTPRPVGALDWKDPLLWRWSSRIQRRVRPQSLRGAINRNPQLQDMKAYSRLRSGLRLIKSSSVLVTDRLHGMVLGHLLEIPTVALDNNWGKVAGLYKTWFEDSPHVVWADSMGSAIDIAMSSGSTRPASTTSDAPSD